MACTGQYIGGCCGPVISGISNTFLGTIAFRGEEPTYLIHASSAAALNAELEQMRLALAAIKDAPGRKAYRWNPTTHSVEPWPTSAAPGARAITQAGRYAGLPHIEASVSRMLYSPMSTSLPACIVKSNTVSSVDDVRDAPVVFACEAPNMTTAGNGLPLGDSVEWSFRPGGAIMVHSPALAITDDQFASLMFSTPLFSSSAVVERQFFGINTNGEPVSVELVSPQPPACCAL